MYRIEFSFVDKGRELLIAIRDTLSFMQNMIFENDVLFD
jgi:hypothetical protein